MKLGAPSIERLLLDGWDASYGFISAEPRQAQRSRPTLHATGSVCAAAPTCVPAGKLADRQGERLHRCRSSRSFR